MTREKRLSHYSAECVSDKNGRNFRLMRVFDDWSVAREEVRRSSDVMDIIYSGMRHGLTDDVSFIMRPEFLKDQAYYSLTNNAI